MGELWYYKVQVSDQPNSKSKYVTKYGTPNEAQAWLLYKGVNIGLGYRKRLVKQLGSSRGTAKVLARSAS